MADDTQQPTPDQEPSPHARTFTFKRSFTFGRPTPETPKVTPVEDDDTFKWEWRGGGSKPPDDEALPTDMKPVTYYEALSGRRDPMRNFFISARRILRAGVFVIAVGIPIALVTLAIFSGQSLETIFFAGILGAIIGLMFATTFPKTPFD